MKKLFFAFALSALTACSIMPQRDQHASDRKQLDDALQNVEVPSVEKTLADSGQQALDNGDALKAGYYYNQLVDKYPNNTEYKLKYAETMRRMGSCRDAIPIYDKAAEAKPNDLDITEGKALCLVSMGEFEKAGPILTDIIQKDPKRWKSINAAGLIFATKHKFNEANQYLDLAAEVSNHSPAVLNNQGLVRALVGNYDDAIKILQEASQRAGEGNMQKRNIDLNLAMVYGISKNMDKAEATAKPWLTTPQLYNNMGIYAELAKDKDLARTYLNKALMGTPIYYDRAWDNLENLDNNSNAPASSTTSSTTTTKTVKAKK